MAKTFDPIRDATRHLDVLKDAGTSLADLARGQPDIGTLLKHAGVFDGSLIDKANSASSIMARAGGNIGGLLAVDTASRAAQRYQREIGDALGKVTGGSILPALSSHVAEAPAAIARGVANTPLASVADLGTALRDARKTLKLSQQAFADLAGVGRRFVSELESGKASVEFGKVLQCCAAAGIDLNAVRRRAA